MMDTSNTLRTIAEGLKICGVSKDGMVTVYIDEYPRRCEESKVPAVLENIEKLKQMYLEKGVPQETLDKMYSVRIVKDNASNFVSAENPRTGASDAGAST